MTEPTTSCPLPAELEFIVIDNLSADKPSLASCSLVCSRWLPTSRRHLFQDITINFLSMHPDPLADFLDMLEASGEENIEWAVGPCITKITFDGSDRDRRSIPTCTLNLLCALLSKLPQLASLYIKKLVILHEPRQVSPIEQGEISRFKLEELVVDGCSTRAHDDPRHLLALLSRFSTIRSLTVNHWWVWIPDAVPTISMDDFSAPVVHSLSLKSIRPVCARAIYALLAGSTSVTDGSLTRIVLKGGSPRDFSAFSDFARVFGQAIQELELRVLPDIPGLYAFSELSLPVCTALRSLVLSIHPLFGDHPSSGRLHADDTREILAVYTRVFHEHRSVFSALATLRIELLPADSEMHDAFVRVAQDTFPEWPSKAMKMVSAEEAEQNRQLWTSLEDALGSFPALERVEFVLYERNRDALTEDAKAELRSALEGRLPRLWPSGVVQLIFEAYVYRHL